MSQSLDIQALKQKRILFLINSLGGGGAERVFIRQLNALHEQGFDVLLATLYREPLGRAHVGALNIPQEKQRCLQFRSLKDIRGIRKLFAFVKVEKVDLVYSTLDEANILARLLAVRFPRLRCVVREASIPERKPAAFKWWDRATMGSIARVIAVSDASQRSILTYVPDAASKITLLLNGVDVPSCATRSVPGRCRLLTVGRCVKPKHQKLIIEAFDQLVKRVPHILFQLDIIGDGELKPMLEEMVRRKRLESRIRFYGHLPSYEVEQFYQKTDVFVLSSLWEGCPNVLLEAMAHGIACVSTSVGGVPDVMQHEKNGLLVPSDDVWALARAIERLITDEGLRLRLGQTARRHIQEHFSFERHMDALMRVFAKSFLLPV